MDQKFMSRLAALLKAASHPELDIVARAQMVEGISGIPANTAMKLFGQSPSTLLGKIQDMCLKISPNVSPSWWDKRESGLYKAAWRGASKIHAPNYDPDDLLQNMLMGIGRSGDVTEVTFHWIGKKIAQTPGTMEKFTLGALVPGDSVLTNMAMAFAHRKAQTEAKLLTQEAQKREESTEGTGDIGTPEAMEDEEWATVLESAMEESGDADVFKWLRKIFSDVGTPGGQKVMSLILDKAEAGKPMRGIDVEVAQEMGLKGAGAYVGRMKKEMVDQAASLLASNKPEFKGFMDVLSDKKFYRSLERGRPMIASEKDLRRALIMLCSGNPALRSILLPILKEDVPGGPTPPIVPPQPFDPLPGSRGDQVAENLTEKATYNTEKFTLSLIGNEYPFDQTVMQSINNIQQPIKMLDGRRVFIPAQIVDSSTSPELSLEDLKNGITRETVITIEIPVGYKKEYLKDILDSLGRYGFKVRELDAFRKAEPRMASILRVADIHAKNLFDLDSDIPGWEVATQKIVEDIEKALELFKLPKDFSAASPMETFHSIAHEVAELWTNKIRNTLSSYVKFGGPKQSTRKLVLDRFIKKVEDQIGFDPLVPLDTYIMDVGEPYKVAASEQVSVWFVIIDSKSSGDKEQEDELIRVITPGLDKTLKDTATKIPEGMKLEWSLGDVKFKKGTRSGDLVFEVVFKGEDAKEFVKQDIEEREDLQEGFRINLNRALETNWHGIHQTLPKGANPDDFDEETKQTIQDSKDKKDTEKFYLDTKATPGGAFGLDQLPSMIDIDLV